MRKKKFYLYKKTFYFSASMTEEQCKEAALSGAERLLRRVGKKFKFKPKG